MKKNRLSRWKMAAMAAVTALSLMFPTAAFAVNVDYEGELDPVTGEAVGGDSITQSDRVQISDDVIYDRTQMAYIYTVNGLQIATSVVDGMIVQGSVSIVPEEGLSVTLYRGGEEVTDANLSNISETGDYVLEATTGGQSQTVMSFYIVGDASGDFESYDMPSGFVVESVTRDGVYVAYTSGSADLSEEGEYVVSYTCSKAAITYELHLIVDRTAPQITISGLDANGRARNAVTISDVEEGAVVTITRDGESVKYKDELTQSGVYTVRVTDEAGNSTDYSFTILIYFDSNSFIFLGLIAGAAVAVIVYMRISRKRLKVR